MANAKVIPLNEMTGVGQVAQLYAEVQQAIQDEQSIILDFSDVHDFDASILQLMVATSKAAKENKLEVEFQNATGRVAETLNAHGGGVPMTQCQPQDAAAATENG